MLQLSASRVMSVMAVCLAICPRASAGAHSLTATTTTMTVSPNPVVAPGDTTVAITVKAATGTAKPSGTASVSASGTVLFTVNLNSDGVGSATVPTTGFAAGVYGLTASYGGSTTFGASTSSVVSVTLKSPVTITEQAIPASVVQGQTAKLEAVVNATDGGGTPTGSVSFAAGGTSLGTAPLNQGSAVLSASTQGVPAGTYPIVATYTGDSLHAAGNSSALNVVLQAPGGTACGTGNETILHGTYAFSLNGFSGGNNVPVVAAGSFVADGTGSVAGGEEDVNFLTSLTHSTISNLSQYSVGADGRGCLTLVTNNQATHTFRFSLIDLGGETAGVSDGGRMIEFDDKTGAGTRMTGGMVQVNASELGLSNLLPNYSFDLGGWQESGGSYNKSAFGGTFAVTTAGAMSSGVTDLNIAGAAHVDQTFASGSISSIDGYGRATMNFTADSLGFQYAVYMVNKGFFFVVGLTGNGPVPVMGGEMHEADTGFTKSNVPPVYVQHVSFAGANQSSYKQVLALTQFTTSGNYSSTQYEYANGSPTTVGDSGTYTVASNGRLVMNSSTGGQPEVFYLLYKGIAAGQGAYVIGLQSEPTSGGADVQVVKSYSDSALAGGYGYGHDLLLLGSEIAQSGIVSLSSGGAVSGVVDESGPTGLLPAQAADLGGSFNFGSNGVSQSGNLVGIATGSNIYVLKENGSLNPILDLTINAAGVE